MSSSKPEFVIDPGRRDWEEDAPCRRSPELFFPEGGTAQKRKIAAKAILICNECPVIVECLTEAIANREPDGVWGGLYGDNLRRHYKRGVGRAAAKRLATDITASIRAS